MTADKNLVPSRTLLEGISDSPPVLSPRVAAIESPFEAQTNLPFFFTQAKAILTLRFTFTAPLASFNLS